MVKKFIKNHIISIAAILVVIGYLFVKFAVPMLLLTLLVSIGVFVVVLFKPKNVHQTQVSGDNSKLVQYSSDKNVYQHQEGGEGSEQIQIHGEE